MSFQTGLLVSLAVMMTGGVIYYFNEEYPERARLTRLGLGILLLGFALMMAAMIFLRDWNT